jgi:hypothetical protein
MSLPKLLGIVAILLFGSIGVAAWMKGRKNPSVVEVKRQTIVATTTAKPQEVAVGANVRVVKAEAPSVVPSLPPTAQVPSAPPKAPLPTASSVATSKKSPYHKPTPVSVAKGSPKPVAPESKPNRPLPEADFISRFFIRDTKQFPIVETIVYKSHVPWLQGRLAWLGDYASHFKTSRHFIARSLHGKKDYFKQDIAENERINVLRPDINLSFYLVVDVLRCKMWFYYLLPDAKEKVLVKSYDVGLGRLDTNVSSGFLTPLGKYTLGERTGIYRPKAKGTFNGRDLEMITVFGSRWIPFDAELEDCTAPSRGLGIHGCPWSVDPATGIYVEDASGIGQHTSDGCIRLRTDDMEELFAIIISRPTTVELVRDFHDAKVPGVEKTL